MTELVEALAVLRASVERCAWSSFYEGSQAVHERADRPAAAPVTRPALRYPGGKWRLAPWIIGHFPAHECYVEPFAGAASVLLRKDPAPYEVLNDRDGQVVNFFRVLRERPDEFIRRVELTPWSRREFELAAEPCDDPLERARRFFVRCWQSYSGGGVSHWSTGWAYQQRRSSNKPKVLTWLDQSHLCAVADRLRRVQIEADDALAVIRRFDTPDTLFYVDPPYVQSTRSKWAGKMYVYEMDDVDHRELARVLHAVEGMVVVSGYPSALYSELYAGWRVETTRSRTNFTNLADEYLWLLPRTHERLQRDAEGDFGPLFANTP